MSKVLILYSSIILLVIGAVSFFFFQNYKFESSFSADTIDEVAVINQMPHYEAQGYQANTAIIPAETEVSADDFADTSYASILVDNTSNTILEAHNIYRRIYPASTTKLMTAILVAKAADEGKFTFDDMVTIDHSPNVTDPDAVASEIKKSVPRIKASKHWPDTKDANVLCDRLRISKVRSAFLRSEKA